MTQTYKAQHSLQEKMALMKGWSTSVEIEAPQQTVWNKVTDFTSYSKWNPFVVEAHAQFEIGEAVQFLEDLKQFGKHWITAEFLEIDPYHSFIWKGHFAAPFLFTVRHSFVFEAIDQNLTRFSQIHENSGLLIPFLALRGVYCVTHQGYLNFDQALKGQCEASQAQT